MHVSALQSVEKPFEEGSYFVVPHSMFCNVNRLNVINDLSVFCYDGDILTNFAVLSADSQFIWKHILFSFLVAGL